MDGFLGASGRSEIRGRSGAHRSEVREVDSGVVELDEDAKTVKFQARIGMQE